MKIRYTLGALAVAAVAQTAQAATEVKTLPLQAVTGQAQSGGDVVLYFGDQAHPPVKSQVGDTSQSSRIARKIDDEATAFTCGVSGSAAALRVHGDVVVLEAQ